MPDYSVDQELVQSGEGSLTFLEPRFWPTSRLPTQSIQLRDPAGECYRDICELRRLRIHCWSLNIG